MNIKLEIKSKPKILFFFIAAVFLPSSGINETRQCRVPKYRDDMLSLHQRLFAWNKRFRLDVEKMEGTTGNPKDNNEIASYNNNVRKLLDKTRNSCLLEKNTYKKYGQIEIRHMRKKFIRLELKDKNQSIKKHTMSKYVEKSPNDLTVKEMLIGEWAGPQHASADWPPSKWGKVTWNFMPNGKIIYISQLGRNGQVDTKKIVGSWCIDEDDIVRVNINIDNSSSKEIKYVARIFEKD